VITKQAGFVQWDDVPLPVMQAAGLGQTQRGDLSAAADAFGPGTILVPLFQPQILDMVSRRGVFGQRVPRVPATGQPSRYIEQTRIVEGASQDPRNLSFQPGQDPTRRERYVTIKAIVASMQFGLFDVALTRQQNQFPDLVAKDVNDMVDGTLKTSDKMLWTGNDTNLVFPTSLQYVGVLNQINRTASIPSTLRIIDGLKAEVASLMANPNFDVLPTAIYVNPVLGDLIDQEERMNQRQMNQITVTGGLRVNALATQAGELPLIPDRYLPNGPQNGSATETNKTDYTAVILMENLVEMHYVAITPGSGGVPQVFQLGLSGSLGTQYMSVLFDAPVVKGNANASQPQGVVESGVVTYAHSKVIVTR
jgi:hypothetical protein